MLSVPNISTPQVPTLPTLPAIPSAPSLPSLPSALPSSPTSSVPSLSTPLGAGSSQSQVDEQAKQDANMKLREALNDAYGALEAQKSVQSFVAFTFEEAMQNQLDRLTGTSTRLRPNELDRVTRIVQNVTTAISIVRQTPPEAFLDPSEARDVNTASSGVPGTSNISTPGTSGTSVG